MTAGTALSAAHAPADAQGGRFHLLVGAEDWAGCPTTAGAAPEWEPRTGSLRLARRDALVRAAPGTRVHDVAERRGADRDRYGTWYRVRADRRGIERLAPGARAATPWWSLADLDARCAPPAGGFGPVPAPGPASGSARPGRLAGLAVTASHHLVAGLVDSRGGLLLFDLHQRGGPTVLRWPGERAITPFDVAATRHGGLLVLDRARRTWWRLDRDHRLVADVSAGPGPVFVPLDPAEAPRAGREHVMPRGHTLPAGGPDAVADPVAITEGPAGVVLVLDRPRSGPSAVVAVTGDGAVLTRVPLTVTAVDPTRPDRPSFVHDVVGQDLACSGDGDTAPLPGPLLYVADAGTAVTEAYRWVPGEPPTLEHQPDELPMRRWGAEALVATGGDVFYDAVGRFVPLEPFGVCAFERRTVLCTPPPVTGTPVGGQPFDGALPGCVWHRLLLDAAVPDGCAITVAARAADDPAALATLPFRAQPDPYRRGGGAELPWHDPWADVARPAAGTAGTWELLFQHVVGRYVQVELTLTGTGRSTPSLRALRAWYPRFSYVAAYLPGAYGEDDAPGGFLERLLANAEGLLTEHEARLDHASLLVDPRTTPAAALDWLASWVGLRLEPAWPAPRKRLLLRHVDALYRRRGTAAGLRALLRLYLGRALDDAAVLDPAPRADDPARIVEPAGAHRFRVLVPGRLDDEQADMVARIVHAARPAHAAYEIRSFSGLLTVGEARVGIDTVVAAGPRFTPIVLGATALGAGSLSPAHPAGVADRVVSDRDRLGELPAL